MIQMDPKMVMLSSFSEVVIATNTFNNIGKEYIYHSIRFPVVFTFYFYIFTKIYRIIESQTKMSLYFIHCQFYPSTFLKDYLDLEITYFAFILNNTCILCFGFLTTLLCPIF